MSWADQVVRVHTIFEFIRTLMAHWRWTFLPLLRCCSLEHAHAFLPYWGPVYHEGMHCWIVSGSILCSSWVKLKRSGSGPPFGNRVPYSLSSSKYGSSRADNGVGLAFGSYWSNLDTKSMASRGVLCLNTFSHGSGLICGKRYSLYSGFIAWIYSRDGVPRILMISTSWSTPLSPGKIGCPSMSSAMTHPTDQTSIVVV